MKNTFDLFENSKNKSSKHKKYFKIYDEIFKPYIDKKITFVEIGILDGGSLEIWSNYFGTKARIIGIDINPECKKFENKNIEIFIGNQSDQNFWKKFYEEVGKVDIVLDDGGHTNKQQIITTIKSVPNINDGGLLVIEDTHTSYMKEFGNPQKFSFINFSKKIIDDVNYTFPDIGNFKLTLNKEIYSIKYFESFCIFYVDRNRCYLNSAVINPGLSSGNIDLSYKDSKIQLLPKFIMKNFNFLKKNKFIKFFFNYFLKFYLKYQNNKLRDFFK